MPRRSKPGRAIRMLGLALALVMSAALSGCDGVRGKAPETDERPQIVLLGFDGVDPDFLEKWMSEGKLPNLQKLAAEGTFLHLRSTNPPQSPVAWSTFATGMNPGKHGIYDFIRRDPASYFPAVATSSVTPPEFRGGLWPSRPAEGHNPRRGENFWKTASDEGVRVTVLNVPYSFPPDDVAETGRQLSGLGTPDLLGTNSSFFYFADDLSEEDDAKSIAGGRLIRLVLSEGEARVRIKGPVDPADKERRSLTLPVLFRLDQKEKRVTVRVEDEEVSAAEGEWTPWTEISFAVSPFYKIYGLWRFYIIQAGPALQVYGSPLNYHPASPYVPFSSPEGYSEEIADAMGFYKTVGWDHDTSALNSERLDEKFFLEDAASVEEQREAMLLRALEADDWDLLLWVSTATDRISHMFYRFLDPDHPRYDASLAKDFGDAIEKAYIRMDVTVGKVMKLMPEEATLIIISDHGFHSFSRGFQTNTWLVRNGYMKLRPSPESPDGRFSEQEFFQDVDWSNTRAYALGTGQIYLNIEGRERDGIVAPEDAASVGAEIAARLLAFKDPETGEKPLQHVYPGREIFPGSDPGEMPDLQLAFREGWRTSWETMLGGIPDSLTVPNTKKWSGDHAASDVADTDGVILVNRRIDMQDPEIMDLAPTLLHQYGLSPPADVDGRRLW